MSVIYFNKISHGLDSLADLGWMIWYTTQPQGGADLLSVQTLPKVGWNGSLGHIVWYFTEQYYLGWLDTLLNHWGGDDLSLKHQIECEENRGQLSIQQIDPALHVSTPLHINSHMLNTLFCT